MHGTSIFRNPNDTFVTAVDLRFKILDASVMANRQGEYSATIRIDIKLAADVSEVRE
jgi:hypothetical protein